jgi:chromosome segregation ATPase
MTDSNQISGLDALRSDLAALRATSDERDAKYKELREVHLRAIDAKFEAARESRATAIESQRQAILKSEASIEKRFDAVNEFRSQLAEQAASFMPRQEADIRYKAIEGQLNILQDRINTAAGRMGGYNSGWGYLMSIVAGLFAFAALIISMWKH